MNVQEAKGKTPLQIIQNKLQAPGVIIWVAFFLLMLVVSLVSPGFMRTSHLLNVARQASGLGIVTIGQTLVILTGGIDLSNGAVITLVNVIAATILNGKDTLILPVVALCIGIGIVVGLVNGLLVTKLKVPAFVSTLGMYSILRGIAYVYTGGAPKGDVPPSLRFFGSGYIGPIPTAVVVWVLLTIFAFFIIRRTPFGRKIYAVGGNAVASRLSGIAVDRILIWAYVISGITAAIAGLQLVGYIGSGSLSLGNDYNLNSVAAVVIGGTAFTGGAGSVMGSAGGALFLAVVFSLLRFLGLEYRIQLVVQGAILAAAIYIYARTLK